MEIGIRQMNRRTKRVLLIGSLAVVTVFVLADATVGVLAGALIRGLDPGHSCETGFSKLSSCTASWS